MKLFERTPTGRPSLRRRPSYSKEYKPLLHKLKRAFSTGNRRFLMICGIFCICLMFILLIIYSPKPISSIPVNNESGAYKNESLNQEQSLNNIKSEESSPNFKESLSNLMQKFIENPENVDMNHIEQLLLHRNDLEKYLKGIDELLLKHKEKIADILPNKIKENEKEHKSSRLKNINIFNKNKMAENNGYSLDKSSSEIRSEIMNEFKYAFDCYKKCAFGYDTLHPISCHGTNDAFDLGLAMIDSLDTMIIMNINDNDIIDFNSDILLIKEWITNKMRFHKSEVALFESTIRIMGGLLSAFHLTNDTIYLDRSKELGDKLMIAFNTKSGIPYASIDFTKNVAFNPSWSLSATSTSEAASIQLEFNYLSYLTNDNKYAESARKAQHLVMKAQRASNPPLLRKFIDINSARFTDNTISFGSRIDSTYEYYLKVPLQLGHHQETEDIWNIYLSSIETAEKELFKYSIGNDRLYIAEMNNGRISNQFDHLVCFMGGALALGSLAINDNTLKQKHFKYGKQLTETCYSIYASTPTHLAPEIVYFDDDNNDFSIHSRDKHNLLRPETVESIFYLYRITNDPKYRYYGYKIFLAFKEFTKAKCGYASINDVTVKTKQDITFRGDKMESFFLAETLKYLYLLFSNHNVIDINKYIFNTEAHPFPRLSKQQAEKLFK